MDKEQLLNFYKKFTEGKDFKLTENEEHLDMILTGLINNQKKHGIRSCPCKANNGSKEQLIKNACPCKFKEEEIWTKENRCWCGLFERRSTAGASADTADDS